MSTKINQHSSFWMDDEVDNKYFDVITGTSNAPQGADIFELVAYQRAIANFVRIACAKNIPVKYSSKGDSMTDGKTVILSKKIDTGNFDTAVGLALHEGSHILLTDFELLRSMQVQNAMSALNNKTKLPKLLKKVYSRLDATLIVNHLKTLLNIIEDRRIDAFMKATCPGYVGYYEALYNEYFNNKQINKILKNRTVNGKDFASYIFHILNMMNPNCTPNILPELDKIYAKIDLANISRLKSTIDSFDLSMEVLDIILNNVEKVTDKAPDSNDTTSGNSSSDDNDSDDNESDENDSDDNESDENDSNDNESDENESNDNESDENESNDNESDENDSDSDDNESDENENDENDENESDSDDNDSDENDSENDSTGARTDFGNLPDTVKKAIAKQQQFVDGKVKKTSLSKPEAKKLEAAIESGATTTNINFPSTGGKIAVTVIKKFNQKTIDSHLTGMTSGYYNVRNETVKAGMRLGAMLASKLKIRNEEFTTRYTRQETGKVDKRLLAELGCGLTNVFDRVTKSNSKEVTIYISIDASGSMGGAKIRNAVKMAIAIARAAEIVGKIRVVIDLRASEGTVRSAGKTIGGANVLVAYDSKFDTTKKIVRLFGRLSTVGGTPEGACFAAIQNNIEEKTSNKDSYFINLSDGEPGCFGVRAEELVELTRKEVIKMKQKGVEVMSYFIGDYGMPLKFTRMYGKDARLINTENIIEISKTLNELLSRRTNITTT